MSVTFLTNKDQENISSDIAKRNVSSQKVSELPEVVLPIDEVKAAIEQKGKETLQSIPDDYIALSNDVNQLSGENDNLSDIVGTPTIINDSIEITDLLTWKPDFPCKNIPAGFFFRINEIASTQGTIILYGIKTDVEPTLLVNNAELGVDYTINDSYDYIRVYTVCTEKTSGVVSVTFTIKKTKGLIQEIDKLKHNIYVDLSDKKISILGVSIDTYHGWIPEENVSYYADSKGQLLNGVEDTWWKKVINSTGATLLKNNSYTGTCATTNGKEYSSSGVARCLDLSDTEENPDIIFVGMFGANDWIYSECGSWDMSDSDLLAGIDVDLSDETNYTQYQGVIETYSGAMATIFYRLQEKYSNARIFALDMYNYKRSNGYNPPRRSQSNKNFTISLYNKALKDVADYFGVTVVHCANCGINAKNSDLYCVEPDGSTSYLHPNSDGHELIYRCVMSVLRNVNL